MKLHNIAIIHSFLLLYIIISTIFLYNSPKTEAVVTYSQVLLFITYFWVLFAQIRLNGITHLFTFFLGIFFLFLLGVPFLDLINLLDIKEKNLFIPHILPNNLFFIAYTFSTFFISIIFCGVLFGYSTNLKQNKNVLFSLHLYQAGVVLFIMALPGLIIKYYIQLKVIFQQGYLSVYNGSLDQLHYPLICYGSGTLLLIGYSIFISSKPNKKQFLIISSIFIITQLINGLKGQRSVLMFPIVFVVWYFFNFFSIGRISKKGIVILILSVALISQTLFFFRSSRGSKISKKGESTFVETYITGFFEQQGVSFFILPYMLDYKLENNRYPYLFAPLDIRSYGKPQTMERLQKFNYLPDHLVYKMYPYYYKEGTGVGSSLIAVFYDLPKALAVIFCFLLGFFISKFQTCVRESRFLMASSFYIVFSVTSSPRYELFQLFYDLVMVWIVFFAIEIIYLKAQSVQINNE